MKETGVVLKTDGETAVVSVKRKSACGDNCAMCTSACTAESHRAKVINELGAKAGDTVILDADSSKVLKGALVLYLLPVVLMIAAYIIAEEMTKSSGIAIASSLLSLVVSYCIIKLFDKRLAPKTRISQIIDKEV